MLETTNFCGIRHGPFTDLPRQVPRERYDEAIELLVSHWNSLPRRPIAIYQIGQVGAPGISDLDFIIVFSGKSQIDWSQFEPETFPSWIQQLMNHPPYCCTEIAWPFLPAWYPIFNLRHVWGEKLQQPRVPERFLSGCALGMLVDYLIIKVPRDFLWIAWERPLRLRILLAMLHSLKHTIDLAELAKIAIPRNAQQTIAEVDKLRESWFVQDHSERVGMLSNLWHQVCEIAGELISTVDEVIPQDNGEPNNPKANFDRGTFELFKFVKRWTYSDVKTIAFHNYAQFGDITWVSPLSFLQVLAVYSDECPQLGEYLSSQGCYTKLRWNGGLWNDGLRYHARAMTTYGESATKIGIPAQKYVALGYVPRPSLWKRLQALLKAQ